MNNPICNTVFDTRDLIEYKDDLRQELTDLWNEYIEGSKNEEALVMEDWDELLIDGDFGDKNFKEIQYLENIEIFCSELEVSPDFEHGEGVIHEDYWTEYCEELLKDCGYLPTDLPSWIEIDFEATAENMAADYMEIDFEGETYYIRA